MPHHNSKNTKRILGTSPDKKPCPAALKLLSTIVMLLYMCEYSEGFDFRCCHRLLEWKFLIFSPLLDSCSSFVEPRFVA